MRLIRSGSGVVQGDGGGGGVVAQALTTATTLAKTADFKQDLFMVRARELASITCHTQHKTGLGKLSATTQVAVAGHPTAWLAMTAVLVAVWPGCSHDDGSMMDRGRGWADPAKQQVRQRIVDLNREALAAYQDDDFETAMDLLTRALADAKKSSRASTRLIARTLVHVGAVYLIGYGDETRALQSFSTAKKLRPTIHMTPAIATPRLIAVFDKAPATRIPARPRTAFEPDLPATMSPPMACSTPEVVPPGQPLFIRCGVDRSLDATSVRLHYRAPAAETFRTLPMQRTPRGWYVVTIPGPSMEAYNLQVYFDAFDDTGEEVAAVGGSDKPLLIRICEDRTSCDFPDLGDFDPDEDYDRPLDASVGP